MLNKLHLQLIAVSLVLCLAAAPFAQAISLRSSAPFTVDHSYGGSIWEDPCTFDGFLIGFGVVTKSYAAYWIGMVRAIHVNNCF